VQWNGGPAHATRAAANEEYRPEAKYTPTFGHLQFEKFLSKYNLNVDDLRSRGGCLWVRTDAVDNRVSERLQNWGFAYRPSMGWWKE
jgi:N6-adenosine-specific RNA methylase IME4